VSITSCTCSVLIAMLCSLFSRTGIPQGAAPTTRLILRPHRRAYILAPRPCPVCLQTDARAEREKTSSSIQHSYSRHDKITDRGQPAN
jgi:hypothetical protein